jgi:ribosome-binding factor A
MEGFAMSRRTERVEKLIKEEISLIFLHKLKDKLPDIEVGFVTITGVKVTPDLKIAKVYISVFDREKREEILEQIKLKTGLIRSLLASRIKIKFTPELKFFIDDTLDYVEKIEGLIKKIHESDDNK